MKTLHKVAPVIGLLFLVPISACLASPAEKTVSVMARGMAEGVGPNAQQKAIDQALRAAFRRTCEPHLPGRADDPAYEAYREQAVSRWRDYIAGHVLRRGFSGEGKTYVQLVVTVRSGQFRRDWGDQTPVAAPEAPPRVLLVVLLDPPPVEGRAAGLQAAPASQRLVETVLARGRVPLANASLDRSAYDQRLVPLALEPQADQLVTYCREQKAELLACVVLQPRRTETLQAGGQAREKYTCRGRAMLLHVESGRLLAAPTIGPTEVLVPMSGSSQGDATQQFTRRLAPKVLAEIQIAWAKRPRPPADVQVVVSGLDRNQWDALAGRLAVLHGVEDVTLSEITDREATAVVRCRTTPQALAAATAGIRSPRLRVTRVADDRVHLSVLP